MRTYKKPILNVEHFVPNEFVASACGESGTVYKFTCNANSGGLFFNGGYVYEETNGQKDLQVGSDTYLGRYKPCSETHEAESTDTFVRGYLINYGLTKKTEVIIWRGENGDDIHCTTNLDIDSWETAKS